MVIQIFNIVIDKSGKYYETSLHKYLIKNKRYLK